MNDLIGWVGGICLALCAVPEVIKTLKNGQCSVGWGMLLLWGVGEVLVLVSIFHLDIGFLIFNYLINIICIGILMYYKRSKT